MKRRTTLKKMLFSAAGLALAPFPILVARKKPIRVNSLLDYYYLFTNTISTRNWQYQQFCNLYGCDLSSFAYSGYSANFGQFGIREKLSEYMWPTFKWSRELWSGADNVSMPVVDNEMYLNGYVGGPHLMGLALIADHIKRNSYSSKLAADYTLPIDTFDPGAHSFKTSSYSDFETNKGNIEMEYDYHGGGRGSIGATITDWDTDESEDLEIPIQFG